MYLVSSLLLDASSYKTFFHVMKYEKWLLPACEFQISLTINWATWPGLMLWVVVYIYIMLMVKLCDWKPVVAKETMVWIYAFHPPFMLAVYTIFEMWKLIGIYIITLIEHTLREYHIVLLYIGIIKVWAFLPKNPTYKSAKYLLLTAWQH